MALFIYLESADSTSWVKLAADGTVKGSGQSPLTEIDSSGERVIVFVPGDDVLLCHAEVPGHKRRLLAQAVPYALEEQLIDDVEELHFAFGAISGEQVVVAVVSQAKMEGWLEMLHEAGMEADQIFPDVLTLPFKENCWHLLQLDNRFLLRTGLQTGMVFDYDNAAVTLQALLAEAGEAKPDNIKLQDFSANAEPLPELDVELVAEPASGLPVSVMATAYDEKNSLNLLQGQYSRRERISKYWRPWRAAAALLAVFVVLQFTIGIVDQQRLTAQNADLVAEIKEIYGQTFPQARDTSGARKKMESALKSLRGGGSADGGGFTELLAKAGEQFKENDRLAVQRLSYKGGQLDVSLTVTDLQQLDQLKQRLVDQAGLNVEIQSASSKGNQVEARMRIKGAAS